MRIFFALLLPSRFPVLSLLISFIKCVRCACKSLVDGLLFNTQTHNNKINITRHSVTSMFSIQLLLVILSVFLADWLESSSEFPFICCRYLNFLFYRKKTFFQFSKLNCISVQCVLGVFNVCFIAFCIQSPSFHHFFSFSVHFFYGIIQNNF